MIDILEHCGKILRIRSLNFSLDNVACWECSISAYSTDKAEQLQSLREKEGTKSFTLERFWVDRTALHEAASHGHVLQLKELIQNGACVNVVTVDSITPLHEASLRGQTQCVKLLLAAGAQVDARNIDGSTPLCDACAAGSIECAKVLLEHGANVNPPLFTATPLHEACMSGNAECVRLMILQGARLEAHDCHFGTPLHVACAREHIDCVKVLLNAGAKVNAAKLHETALHHAAKVKNVDLIELLVQFGGNVYARDNQGKKPVDYTRSGTPASLCLQFYESR
ncbi:ASB13 protein, partial [Polypterus senegalus]|nr:ASB13 protein [Polypterus senegalus]